MSQSSSKTSLSASYNRFDGSLARRVSLNEGDEVSFILTGGNGLEAVVMDGTDAVFDILDGDVFTAPKDGRYDFTLQGQAENGSFSLNWQLK